MKTVRLIAVSLVILNGCDIVPPLRITKTKSGVMIGVETLGEYPTTISRIKISEARSGVAVLELCSDSEPPPQIWNISLEEGENLVDSIDLPEPELYRVVVPSTSRGFTIKRNITYLVEVWGRGAGESPATGEFRL